MINLFWSDEDLLLLQTIGTASEWKDVAGSYAKLYDKVSQQRDEVMITCRRSIEQTDRAIVALESLLH